MADYADLIGTPFEYGGRAHKGTFDCYGLVMEMAKRDGVELPDFGWHSDQGVIGAMMGATLPQWEETEKKAGAVVLMRVGFHASHVGYMIDDDRMIHAWHQSNGVSVVSVDAWKRRIIGFYKYVGIKKEV